MYVYAPKHVEAHMSLIDFRRYLKVLPYSIMISLLEASLHIEHQYSIGMNGEGQQLQPPLAAVSSNVITTTSRMMSSMELLDIVLGKNNDKMNRPMLANGDASWARQVFQIIDKIEAVDQLDENYFINTSRKKFDGLKACLSLAYTLALTRSNGSDGYYNNRIAAYGEFNKFHDGAVSRSECKDTYDTFIDAFGGKRVGCGLHEALMFVMYKLDECNQIWEMKPDNFFLMFQILISDLMLALNYHDSVIQGACNGIGATIIVCDGGGSYRKKYRVPGGENEAVLSSKSNGTGVDYVMGEYKTVIDINAYVNFVRLVDSVCKEIKRTTELGLLGVMYFIALLI